MGQQFEIFARIPVSSSSAGLRVLMDASGKSTAIGVDFESELVYVDGTMQGSKARRAGPLYPQGNTVTAHVIIDHSLIEVIFNNRTALTVMVAPSETSNGS